MKRTLFYLTVLFASVNMWSQVTINKTGGWMESAFVEWVPVSGADSYNVYYTGGGQTDKKIDNPLIRSYNTYFRADVPGIPAGDYTIKVAAVTGGVEGTPTTTGTITVIAQDRTGFAFDGGRLPGGYNMNGAPKTGAVILYITQNTKNSISYNIVTSTKGTTTNYVGLQNILYGIKKGLDTRPFIIRLIGNITDMTVMEGGDITIENGQNPLCSLTIEGVGADAVVNGMGVRIKNATNIEVSNLGFMNCDSTAGDDVGMQQDNNHIWVHNCDLFYGDAGSDADQIKGDGALDNKGTTFCTFSYNHFWDNGKASLLGLSEGTTTGLYVTYHHNWFDHSDSRHPRVRFYSAHIYNNYFDGNAKYGSGSTLGSSLFVEGNYFRNAKHPMMISMQGTDVWSSAKNANDPANQGTFSSENGGMIKSYNNIFDADIATNDMRFVAYNDPNPAFNKAGIISSTTDFDAYVPATRAELVPNTVISKLGSNTYNNFDTDPALYVKTLVVDAPAVAKTKVMQYSGRVSGGDLKWTFNNASDDASYLVITGLKSLLTNYTSNMLYVQGETPVIVNTQTLSSDADSNQTVLAGNAIETITYTWGGDAVDATITGLPASGISFVKNSVAKTITVSGTPTADVPSFSVTTSGTGGTPVTINGSVTIGIAPPPPSGDEIHDFTASGITSTFYTFGATANLSTSKGTITYNNLTLTQALKMETATTITYTTTLASTLTLVMNTSITDPTAQIKFDGTNYNEASGIITLSVSAGTHTIAKSNSANLFYIKTSYPNLGIGQNELTSKLTLYPNPVTNTLNISSDENVESVFIYSLSGALVKSVKGNVESIDVSNFTSGSYLVSVTTDQGTSTQKIIKR